MKKSPPLAQSPLVALAEQANTPDVAHAILLVRTEDGGRAMWPMDESDPDVLVGLMAWGIHAINADLPDDD